MSNANSKPKKALGQIQDGIMGVGIAHEPERKSPKVTPEKNNKVAIYSSKNLYWGEVGRLLKGYNIVTAEQAEQWLTTKHTRIATPEEVAGAYNN
jgi:hypothetical protein